VIIATAGHVDHGKTLLVKALTGVDADRLPEEKARGLTIELGFAYQDLGDGSKTGFVDVPGHERFVRTMVAGVSGIDVILFVVAADDGPMPQTIEHLAILDLLRIRKGVVALTKIDRVDQARLSAVSDAVREIFAPTSFDDIDIVPVSSLDGTGIPKLRNAILSLKRDISERSRAGNFRLAIDRSFLLKGAGRVVTGTVFSGQVRTGDIVHHTPHGKELRVRAIHSSNSKSPLATAGQRCALNITGSGLRRAEFHRGDWIVGAGCAFATSRIDVEIRVLESEVRALRSRTSVHVHIGAADTTGRIRLLDSSSIAPGDFGRAQIRLEREVHAVRGDLVILRDQSARRTVGGGEILDPAPLATNRPRETRFAHLDAMMQRDALDSALRALETVPGAIEKGRFSQSWNLTQEEASDLWHRLPMVSLNTSSGLLGFHERRWRDLRRSLVDVVKMRDGSPGKCAGVSDRDLIPHLSEPIKIDVLDALVSEVLEEGAVVRERGILCLEDRLPKRSEADQALWLELNSLLEKAGFRAPVVHDLIGPLSMKLNELKKFLERAAQQGYLTKVSDKRFFLPAVVLELASIVCELATSGDDGEFTVADYRDRVKIGRNAVVEILEYFDRIGFTRRHGQGRKLLDASKIDILKGRNRLGAD